MAAERCDEGRTGTTGTVSVDELCRRLGTTPTADPAVTGPSPLLVGDLLRREGHPAVLPEEADESVPAAAPGIPVPRRRTVEACKTALGAGGLVVAGSVLGAALLAAAGVGGPLFPGQSGDEGQGEVFGGGASTGVGGTAHGAVTGQRVVYGSGLLRSAFASFAPRPAVAPAARPRTAAPAVARRAAAGTQAAAVPAPRIEPVAPGGLGTVTAPVTTAVAPVTGAVGGVVAPVTTTVGDVVAPVTTTVGDVLAPVTGTVGEVLTPATGAVGGVVAPVARTLAPVVEPVAAAVAPAATALAPVTSGAASVVAPVVGATAPVVGALTPVVTTVAGPVLDAAAPVVGAAAPVVAAVTPVTTPVLNAVAPAVTPLVQAAQPALDPVLSAVGPALDPVLAVAAPVLPLTDGLTAAAGLPDLQAGPPAAARSRLAGPVTTARSVVSPPVDTAGAPTTVFPAVPAAGPVASLDRVTSAAAGPVAEALPGLSTTRLPVVPSARASAPTTAPSQGLSDTASTATSAAGSVLPLDPPTIRMPAVTSRAAAPVAEEPTTTPFAAVSPRPSPRPRATATTAPAPLRAATEVVTPLTDALDGDDSGDAQDSRVRRSAEASAESDATSPDTTSSRPTRGRHAAPDDQDDDRADSRTGGSSENATDEKATDEKAGPVRDVTGAVKGLLGG